MARKKINSNQLSFDFEYDTEEEKHVAKYTQTIETIIDDLMVASSAEVTEVEDISQSYQPIVPDINLNDGSFLASSWLKLHYH